MATVADKKLLPASISDFRTPEFWKGFFEARGGKAFEWYGSWDHFGGNILSAINSSPLLPSTAATSLSAGYSIGTSASSGLKLSDLKVLVLGCGNSDMSFEMHAAGLTNITNVDFDKGVIDEMRAKGEKRGQAMRWEVMDVTNMAAVGTKTFHVVVDKGTLDAMMTDSSAGTTESVSKMFSEVERVLVPNGLYLTITLAQDHLVSHYLSSLVSAQRKAGVPSWASVRLEPFRKLDYSSRALQFVCVAQKSDGKATHTAVSARIPETFEPIFDVTDTKKGKKRGGAKASPADIPAQPYEDRPLSCTPTECVAGILQAINEMGWGFQLFKQVSSMVPNQYTQFDIWRMPRPEDKSSNPWAMMVSPYGALPHTSNTAAIDGVAPRYSVSMVDISLAYSAAIVLVPQGREHEWAFGTKEGQFDLARSAMKYGRVFFVYLNRGHVFQSQRIVQDELSVVLTRMIPAEMRSSAPSIPFLAVAEDVGHRELVTEGVSELSGKYYVEDVAMEGTGSTSTVGEPNFVRRLIFMSNQNAIQTEVPLVKDGKAVSFHNHVLQLEYQQAIVASLGVIAPTLHRPLNILIIGVGGGSLPSFLHKCFTDAAIVCVDLDPTVIDLATKHFGLEAEVVSDPTFEPATCKCAVADGLKYIAGLASSTGTPSQRPDVIIVDVDAKDIKSGLSFPPPAFLHKDFIAQAHSILNDGGLFLVNFACRVKVLQGATLGAISKQFGNAAFLSLEDTGSVNSLLMAVARPAAVDLSSSDWLKAASDSFCSTLTSSAALPAFKGKGIQYVKEWLMKVRVS